MNLERITNPTALPVDMTAIKNHLRIENDETAFDGELTDLILTAAEYVQSECHLQLITTQYKARWNSFPRENYIKVPLFPVVTIDALQYYNNAGTLTAFTDYQTELYQSPCKVYLGTNAIWPTPQEDKINSVVLTFTAGHGVSSVGQPYQVRHLIKLLVAHWFRNREAVLTGTISKEIELAFDSIKNQIRVNEFEEFIRQ